MPANDMHAGALRHRLQFQKPETLDDGYGQGVEGGGGYEPQFTVWAGLKPLRGSEAVMAARLRGQQPYIATVRQSVQTRQVTAAWRIVDENDPNRVFSINSPPTDPDGKRGWLEILVSEGKPT